MSPAEPPLSRRGFLTAAAAAFAAACSGSDRAIEPSALATTPPREAPATTSLPTVPAPTPEIAEPEGLHSPVDTARFPYGVASGDPTHDSVILWTRGEFGLTGFDASLRWAVATDAEFEDLVATGETRASEALGFSVHVDAAGLQANTWYWYKFFGADGASPVGRTRTMPEPDSLEPIRFGFSSCQNLEQGWYAAHRHLATADLDLFVWLGDYIYEGGPAQQPLQAPSGAARIHESPEVTTLDGYRARYAQYKSDPDLQAHHAARPWIVSWDDHEVENGYAGDISQYSDDRSAFRARRGAAYQAWYENMPVRLPPPDGPDYRIHRTAAWGDLLQFNVLDGRQYRANQPTDGEPISVPGLLEGEQVPLRALGPNALDPNRSMLGADQEQWLIEGVRESDAVWQVLAQPVFMSGANVLPGAETPVTFTDTWDGYAGSRRVLLEALAGSAANLVVLTGDFHSGAVADVRTDPFDPQAPVVATEFMASSISSLFPDASPQVLAVLLAINPHVRHFDPTKGFVTCAVGADRWESTYFAVTDVGDPDSAVTEIAAFQVLNGVPGAVAIQ